MAERDTFLSVLEELVDVTVERLECEAVRDRAASTLSELALGREAAQRDSEQAVQAATVAVLSLPRAQLEELRSLSNPPRVVREALALLYAVLQPGELLESVEHACWDSVVSVLRHDKLQQRIADLPAVHERASVLLAAPAIRRVMELLDTAVTSEKDAAPQNKLPLKMRTPMGARTPKSFAAGMTAQLLSLTPQSEGKLMCMPLKTRQRLVLCGQDESEMIALAGDARGLLCLLRESGRDCADEVTSVSSAAGALLRWSLYQLQSLKAYLPARANGALAEKTAQQEQQAAEWSLVNLALREGSLVQEVVRDQHHASCDKHMPTGGLSDADAKIVADTMIRFSKGSALMSSLAIRPLAAILDVLKRETVLRLVVVRWGTSEENENLPLKRAQIVRNYLESKGIAPERFSSVAMNGSPQVSFSIDGLLPLEHKLCFAACSDALMPEAVSALEPVAALLKGAPFLHLSVDGHADSDPMWMGNVALSEARANRVASHLREIGAPGQQVHTAAYSDQCPRASNQDAEGKAANRRVELRLLLQQSVAQLRLTRHARSLPVGQARTSLLTLAYIAADRSGSRENHMLGKPSSPNQTELSVGLVLRKVAAEELVIRGAAWGPKLLGKD